MSGDVQSKPLEQMTAAELTQLHRTKRAERDAIDAELKDISAAFTKARATEAAWGKLSDAEKAAIMDNLKKNLAAAGNTTIQ